MKQKNNEVTFHIFTDMQIIFYYLQSGHAVALLAEALRYNPESRGFDFFSFNQQSFRPHYGLGVGSACVYTAYHEYFLGVKAAGA
jgi:hypothetical protein